MTESTSRDPEDLEGLDVIRRRPAMYIGDADGDHTLCGRLVESVVGNVASDTPPPKAVRLTVWAGDTVTVAFDGEPLPVAPYSEGNAAVAHPELYRMFMYMASPATKRPLSLGGAIVNALSSRLIVSTVHDGIRYRAVFSRGALVSMLTKAPTNEPLGTSWLTFAPDASILPGPMTFAEAEAIVLRVHGSAPHVDVTAIDATTMKPDWW